MNRLILIPVLIFSLTGAANAQKSVKSMKMYVDKKLSEVVTYNPDGHVLSRETLLSDDPQVWFKEVMMYRGKLLDKSSHYIGGANIADYEYFYNEKSQLERRRERQNDSVSGVTYFEFHETDRLQLETNYIGKTKKIITGYSYNSQGLVTRRTESIVEEGSNLVLAEEYYYDKAGHMERMIGLNGNDTLSDISYAYDEAGRRIRQYVYSHGDTTLTIEWEYKKDKTQPSVEKHKANGFVVRQTASKYNKTGLKKREKTTEYRVFSGNMKPQKTTKKFKYTWYSSENSADVK